MLTREVIEIDIEPDNGKIDLLTVLMAFYSELRYSQQVYWHVMRIPNTPLQIFSAVFSPHRERRPYP